jgi:copper homeostasis protein
MTVLVEAAVDSVESAMAAARGGAGRLELCANLAVGGTTPSGDLIDAVLQRVSIPVVAMVRPRGGSFVHPADEVAQMHRDLEMVIGHEVHGVVLGILTADGVVDEVPVRALVALAGATPVVFHKAFDRIADRRRALTTLIDIGVARVLTSAGRPSAIEGAHELAELLAQADGRIEILAGGKVRGDTVQDLVNVSGVTQVHARCELDERRIRDIVEALA